MTGLAVDMLYLCVHYLGRHPLEVDLPAGALIDLAICQGVDAEINKRMFGGK